MSVLAKISDVLKSQSRLYGKKYNEYTKTILYFEFIIDKKSKRPISCKVVDSIPNNAMCQNIDDYNSLTNISIKVIDDYFSKLTSNESFIGHSLNDMSFDEWQKSSPEAFNNYIHSIELAKQKCEKNSIQISDDRDEIMTKVVNMINRKEINDHNKIQSYKPSQIVLDNIDDELLDMINSHNFDSKRFEYYDNMIFEYIYAFEKNYPICDSILNKDDLTENDKEVLQSYYEFLMVMPKLYGVRQILRKCSERIELEKEKYNESRYKTNDNFISSISNLMAKCNPEKETLYIHAAVDLNTSMSIINNGLYTFGGIDTFGFGCDSIEQILSYEYGNSAKNYDSYIILFRVPVGSTSPTRISDEEAKNAIKYINMRREGLMIEPTGKIDSSDILGIIDKRDMKVIENPNFKVLNDERSR